MTDLDPASKYEGNVDSTQQRQAPGTGSAKRKHPHARAGSPIPRNITREEAIRRLDAIYRLTRLVGDRHYNMGEMARLVARLVSGMIGDLCVVTLLNMERDHYHIAAYHDPDPDVLCLYEDYLKEVGTIPSDQGWVAKVIKTGQPLLIPTITVEEANLDAVPRFRDFNRRVGIKGILIVPITGHSGVLGALAVSRHRGAEPYDDDDQAFLMEMGYRVGLAIENAILIDSLRGEISRRQFVGEALAASEQRFLSIFQSAGLGIKVMDLGGSILQTNPAFQAMSGYDEADLVAMHFRNLVHPDDVLRVQEVFKELKTGGQPRTRLEHRMLRKDGSVIWVRTTFAGVKKGNGDDTLSLIFGITENITELRDLEQHLQRGLELERLRLAQELHDGPMQDLYGATFRLEEAQANDPALRALVKDVTAQLQNTINDLRGMAGELRPPALSRFGLEKAIRSYVEDFQARHPNIKLRASLAADHQSLPQDVRLTLFRVLQHALANVLRHSQASEVVVRFTLDAEEARLAISDNGIGFEVPPNWISFVRQGHYGLAGAAERLNTMGGVLLVQSIPRQRTTITAVIPRSQADGDQ